MRRAGRGKSVDATDSKSVAPCEARGFESGSRTPPSHPRTGDRYRLDANASTSHQIEDYMSNLARGADSFDPDTGHFTMQVAAEGDLQPELPGGELVRLTTIQIQPAPDQSD